MLVRMMIYYHYLNLAARESDLPRCPRPCQRARMQQRVLPERPFQWACREESERGLCGCRGSSLMVWALLLLPHLFTGVWRV